MKQSLFEKFPVGKEFSVVLKIEEPEAIWNLQRIMYGNEIMEGVSIQQISFENMVKNDIEEELFKELALAKGYVKKDCHESL